MTGRFCATEGGVCAFTGTTEVRYGANGSFVFKTLTDGTACTNEVFGDPIFGTVKDCAIRSTPPPSEWTVCATEGGVCAFTGTMEVRYGVNGAFVYRTLTDGTACTNEVFGDPIYGTREILRHADPAAAHGLDVLRGGRRGLRIHRRNGSALRGERRVRLPDVDRRHRVYQRGVRGPHLRRGQVLQSSNRLTIATAAIESYAGYEPKRWPEGCAALTSRRRVCCHPPAAPRRYVST